MLTQKDLLDILKFLKDRSIKDSELPSSNDIKKDDYIPVVLDGENKKIRTDLFLSVLRYFMQEGSGGTIPILGTLEELENVGLRFYGNLVYIRETDTYYTYSNAGVWEEMLKLHVGSNEPLDTTCLWIDLEDSESLDSDLDDTIKNLTRAVLQLLKLVLNLLLLSSIGIIPGDSTTSVRTSALDGIDPEKPDVKDENGDDILQDLDNEKPDTTNIEHTVKAICAKQDTAVNFSTNRANLVNGELLFYTDRHRFAIYYDGKFYTIQSLDLQGGGSGGLSVEDLYNLKLEQLLFTDEDNKSYKVKVDTNGTWRVIPYNSTNTPVGGIDATWGSYLTHRLCMNNIYCGGDYNENNLVSHNYIELANSSDADINLKGLYLLYTDGSKQNPSDVGYIWKVLPLDGIIKSGGTFLIRGARCNSDKSSFITVDSYDIEWKDNNNLIKFNQGCSSFYLCVGNAFLEDLDNHTLNAPWNSSNIKVGYVDSCGFGQGSVGEGSAVFQVYNKDKLITTDWSDIMFVRWFSLDPSKLANKAYSARKTTDLWTYINLNMLTTKLGNSVLYYYPDEMKLSNTPKASYLNKDFFTNKSHFREDKPNIINITFGILATASSNKGATRCFNWVSVGNYNEFIEYRKKGSDNWEKRYSIIESDISNTPAINKFIEHYKRYRWCTSDGTWVTTHKCIIPNLSAGLWEYRIGRDNNSNYTSDILTFVVELDTNVTNFSFIQISDLLGFNWMEYTAWKKASYMINKNESDYKFTINTGDITQSGNRVSEWIDYYDGRQYLRNKEEMFTIGNNDLCGHVSTELTDGEDATSKYNHINVLRYYCFELDPNNDNHSVEWDGNTYPIYSLYSFNYGAYHFVCLNSEVAEASSKMYKDWLSNTYKGDASFAKAVNAKIEDWFKKDLQLWKGTNDEPTDCGKCICYMHEMPFTIVTYSFMSGTAGRKGSHLNTLNDRGNYRFSRLFKKYGIRLIIGGHKHTYCLTKPIYDAPTSSNELMDNVSEADSRKPIIQVLRLEDIKTNDYARYELVSKINAPTYSMCLATGYKLVSNKEQPSDSDYPIPWLMAYFKLPDKTGTGTTENVALHKPMYIKYDLSDTDIKITANLIENIWNVNTLTNKKSFDIHNLLTDLSVTPMTLSTTTEEDKLAYNITNIDSYTITL